MIQNIRVASSWIGLTLLVLKEKEFIRFIDKYFQNYRIVLYEIVSQIISLWI